MRNQPSGYQILNINIGSGEYTKSECDEFTGDNKKLIELLRTGKMSKPVLVQAHCGSDYVTGYGCVVKDGQKTLLSIPYYSASNNELTCATYILTNSDQTLEVAFPAY